MSYITERFLDVNKDDNSCMTFKGNVIGWMFKDTLEFRPLMDDATQELFLAGLIDAEVVSCTHQAYQKNLEKVLEGYSFKPDAETIAEMKAEFGEGERVTNILTGQFWDL
jgi:hypothetical protein